MFIVGNTLIDDDVRSAAFACDLTVCRGACCCLEGGRGAPLTDGEVHEIERALPFAQRYLPADHAEVVERTGGVEGIPGDHATRCVDNKACVFVCFEGGIARCAFERAFLDGLTTWRKPLSCHLFPIRLRHHGQDYVVYERLEECAAGRDRGAREGISLASFLREPLIRRFGEAWYAHFAARCTAATPTT